ncbi:hypothetical protein BJX99DRAFT_204552 [Aspergillus californicus]
MLAPRNNFVSSNVTESDIYQKWLALGKPHMFICFQCREPGNMIPCSTCCRSYHKSCLSLGTQFPASKADFHCPACRVRDWHRTPPTSERLISTNAPDSSTPIVCGGQNGVGTVDSMVPLSSRRLDFSQPGSHGPRSTSMVSSPPVSLDPSVYAQARELLLRYGHFPESQQFSMDLLMKLGSMMNELDARKQQVQDAMAENAHLRQDNSNIRAYLDLNLATGRPTASSNGDLSSISRPSADTEGKSWDRIVIDLI